MMIKNITLSIIMATYDKEKVAYFHQALESIWERQTVRPDEIILVEDGVLGSDLEEAITLWEAKAPLRIIRNRWHRGLASCLNQAIEAANGQFIARMDSDDISFPYRFEHQLNYFSTHPDCDILGGSLEEFNDEGPLHFTRIYPATHEQVLRSMYKASPLGHPSVMFRRKVFDNGLRYRDNFNMCEDVSLWFDAVANGYVINSLQEPILHFRRTANTVSKRAKTKAFEEFFAYNDGINKVYGRFSLHKVYSFFRLGFRLLPEWIIRRIYNNHIRNTFV